MAVVVAVPKEVVAGEQRVAIVPEIVEKLSKAGHEVRVERDAGRLAFYPDDAYVRAGAKVVAGAAELYQGAQIVLK
ncbi:MAG TPA: NAD(P)(+) transhydrogenase (Re/Si-specific) subunit alpha, partial [Thermoplasmata archaeon]